MRIIVVDDERLALWVIKKRVQKAAPDAEIVGFRKSQDALQYAKEHRVDVAFLDVEMPGIHGLFLARHLQDIYPNVNIIFVSAAKDYMEDAWEIHASGFVLKPVSDERVAEELQHLRYMADVQLTTAVSKAPQGA